MRRILSILLAACIGLGVFAADFDENFYDATLRIDVKPYPVVYVGEITQCQGWFGRRVNLDHTLYPEALKVEVLDFETDETLYVDMRSFIGGEDEVVPILVPKPKRACTIVINNIYGEGIYHPVCINLTVNDLSNLKEIDRLANPYRTLRAAADPNRCVNVAIVAEGFRADEADVFYRKAEQVDSALFCQPGFRDRQADFNVVAVMLESKESGVNVPSQGTRINNFLGAHLESCGLDRLMTITELPKLWDNLAGIPAWQVMIIANTDMYGGSGSYNDYAIAAAGVPSFIEMIIHEFGHSFLFLADEYESGYSISYSSDYEPLEPNITTLADGKVKWIDLIASGEVGLYEGAGYQEKGVWRACEKCLMRSLGDHYFCPVCREAIHHTIDYYLKEKN